VPKEGGCISLNPLIIEENSAAVIFLQRICDNMSHYQIESLKKQ